MSSEDVSVELSSYRDQHFKGTRYEQEKLLKGTATLYVGNLGEEICSRKLKLSNNMENFSHFSILHGRGTDL